MENEILPSSSGGYDIGSCGTHLGKRTSRPGDLPEFSWHRKSCLKENGLVLGSTTEESAPESTANQSKCAKMVQADHFQGGQFNYNNVEGSKLTCNRKFLSNEVDKINRYPFVQLQSAQHQHSRWHHPYQEDMVSGNPVVASRMPLEMHNVSSGFVREVGAVEQNFRQVDTSYTFSHGRGCPEEVNRFRNSRVLGQSFQFSNSTGSNNPSSRDTPSSGVLASTEQKLGGRTLHNDVQSSIGSFDNHVENILETRGRGHVVGDMKMKGLEAMDKENIKSSLTNEPSSKDDHCPTDGVQQVESNKSNSSSHKLNDKSRLPPNKMPPGSEKLWDGSIKLNSTTTVSVVAFFKSGEKLLDLKWSEFVEVKGKVRLDAFENFIQGLPRSRNRGLMVISICIKEGSSAKGLKGMKEVAKEYIKNKRVGVAKFSTGADLYLCPRSDAIITILAKYGFFKGMAAVEGNSELMIGCVVWRKNQTALSSVPKRSEEKVNSLPEQLQKSPSDSSTLQGGGQSSLSVPSVENSKPSALLNSSSGLEKADVDGKNVSIDSSSRLTLTTSAVKSPPFQQRDTGLSSSQFCRSKGQLSSSEASRVHQSNAEPPKKSTTDLPKAATSMMSNASKPNMTFSDDDDLPEFDFGGASGVSSSSHCCGRSILENRLQLSRSRILDMSKQPSLPSAPSVSMTMPRPVSSVSQDMPLARNVADHAQLVTVSRQMEQKHNSQSHAIPVAVTVTTSGSSMAPFGNLGRKNLFSDDDMPEWLPPDAQNEKTIERPVTFHPESSSTTSRKLTHYPAGPAFPYPSSTRIHNGFSSRPSPPQYHLPANSRVPPPIPSQVGPSYLTGFTFNPVPRPQFG